MTLSVGYFNEARSARLSAQINQNINGVRDVLNLTVTSLCPRPRNVVSLIG